MKTFFVILSCAIGALAYSHNQNDEFGVEVASNIIPDTSGKLFWDKLGIPSNQVGSTGIWDTIQNKFPFLSSIFSSRMELPQTFYGPPNYFGPQYTPTFYPQTYFYRYPQFPSYNPQLPGRDVQFTDDAVIVTNPQFPVNPQPIPRPEPAPEPSGYQYSKPQYRLNLPQK